ncbi:MAG: integrase, partial [Verrucomicrobiota bacterium]
GYLGSKGTDTKQIRASVITNWVRKYNLREAQYLAGHRYVSSTERYQKVDPKNLKKAISQYHPLQ